MLQLRHEDLAFDPVRQVYYATISSVDRERGNAIATIDRAGTLVATTAPLGSSPTAVAVSADGSRLYVGLKGSGELALYALPDFSLLGRIPLPDVETFGRTYAEQISVSPDDPDTVAVSLAYSGSLPRHAGVVIVKDMAILPTQTRGHTGSNRIGFGLSGNALYGFNNESTEYGVRRLVVDDTGVREAAVLSVADAKFSWDLSVFQGLVMVGNKAFDADTLAPRGTVGGASFHCVPVAAGSRVACFSTNYGGIVVAETVFFHAAG
jgi:hypothetical protein